MTARLRELLHDVVDELVNVLEKDETPARTPTPAPRTRKTPSPRLPPAPATPPSEIDQARARQALSRLGFLVQK